MNKVIVIVGPTASGKSSVANALAKKLNSYVISADSMQIYKSLDVGTAKETFETTGVKQLLTDICEVTEEFNVCEYKKMAYEEIENMQKQGLIPIVCGGTGLYINSIINNIEFLEYTVNNQLQDIVYKEYKIKYEHLSLSEKQQLVNCNENNLKRLEGKIKKKILYEKLNINDTRKINLWEPNEKKYDFLVIYLETPRDLLYHRINERVDGMIANGLLKEARHLFEQKQLASKTAIQAIGYKELFEYFKENITLEQAMENLKRDTRHYAKRQITWFNKLPNTIKIDTTIGIEKIVQEILERYNEK